MPPSRCVILLLAVFHLARAEHVEAERAAILADLVLHESMELRKHPFDLDMFGTREVKYRKRKDDASKMGEEPARSRASSTSQPCKGLGRFVSKLE